MALNFKQFKRGDVITYTWSDASRTAGWNFFESGKGNFDYIVTTVGIFIETTKSGNLLVTSDIVKDKVQYS